MSFPLSPEVTLLILSHLPFPSLSALARTSRLWHAFIETNELEVYRNAAIRHFAVPSSTPFDNVKTTFSQRALAGSTDWKSFCKVQLPIQQAWLGKSASDLTYHGAAGENVYKIKVDERKGFIVVTTSMRQRELRITDMNTGELVWALPEGYVSEAAHCEYHEGFVVFNRGSDLEVWKLVEQDGDEHVHAASSPPDEAQFRAAATANSTFPKRKFTPWALLHPPPDATVSAFDLAYPTIVAGSSTDMHFWDVPSGSFLQTINLGAGSGELRCLALSADGIAFVSDTLSLRGFSLATGLCVFDIPSTQYSYGDNSYTFEADENQTGWLPDAILKPQPVLHRLTSATPGRLVDQFWSVRLSECGSHLVALLSSSRVIIVPFYRRVIDGVKSFREIALDIQVGSPQGISKYLALESNRIGVATVRGIYVLSLDFESCRDNMIYPPTIVTTRAACFSASVGLNSLTSLQLGPTGIYFNWFTWSNPGFQSVSAQKLLPDDDREAAYVKSLSDERITTRAENGDETVEVSGFQHVTYSLAAYSINLAPVLADDIQEADEEPESEEQ
ncbi:F-box domain-containing protein [Mycena indigotica]|uniref:F-box domain-containing protein n=1 Tax=Mycena indigotica TaxID=2126181 RepID=A0A8H6WH30_9AGAR|nr:F-box domain-containing protein [Mycena indigotica]KAF7316561.1 F-box domain-containing protein [Mycena indigotica]